MDLAAWSVPVFIAAFVGLDLWIRNGGVPFLVHDLSFVAPLVLAVVILWLAWGVRRFQQGKRNVNALTAARIAILAQGGSRAGAVLTGAGAALLLAYQRAETLPILAIGLATGAAVVLVVASLVAEKWCSVDRPEPDAAPSPKGAAPA